ncbi:MAG: PLP-dependent aminotransferase family protein [Spirochaetaceae bacterium]
MERHEHGHEHEHDEETTQTTVSAEVIDLGVGHPGLGLLPVELVGASAREELARGDPRILQYGYEQGAAPFREALSAFMERTMGVSATPRDVFVSGGVSQALDLLCSLFTRPGDLVLAEEPTYFLALRIFEDHGLRVRSVSTDADGLIPEAVEEAVAEEQPAFLYTIPVHQNPSGVTMSAVRRERVVSLAERHGFLVLADEVYHLLTYDETVPRPFSRYVDTGRVCALGSFSKILAPGLRMGWIHAHRDIVARIVGSGFLDSGGGLAPFTSALLTRALEDGSLEGHLRHLRSEYRRRRDALVSALGSGDLELSRPGGGYFVWAALGEGQSATQLLPRAREAGVGFVPGERFSPQGELQRYLRLSFSYYDPDRLAEGARRLLTILRP